MGGKKRKRGKKTRRSDKICPVCGLPMIWVTIEHDDMSGKAQGYWLCPHCRGEEE